MLNLPPQVRVFVCTRPTDMRKSFDGLCGLVEEVFDQQALSGHLFVFVNRRRDRVKILAWEGDGLSIWYKRLEAGTFQIPAVGREGVEVDAAELSMLLSGVDLNTAQRRKRYRRAS
jgi:transposase